MKKRDSPKFLGNPSRVRPGQLPRWSGSSGHCDGPVLPAPWLTATAPTLSAFRGCLPRPTLFAVYASPRRGSLADLQDSLPAAGQALPVEGLSPSQGSFEKFRPCPGSGRFPPLPSFLGARGLRSALHAVGRTWLRRGRKPRDPPTVNAMARGWRSPIDDAPSRVCISSATAYTSR